MAVNAGMRVVAVVRAGDTEMLRKLGAGSVIDSTVRDFEKHLPQVDSILDTVGGADLIDASPASAPPKLSDAMLTRSFLCWSQ